MADGSVVNAHWFGGKDKLPAGTTYIGRPSKHGNDFSSGGDPAKKLEACALHLVSLYQSFRSVPGSFAALCAELDGQDLACWCKNKHTFIHCHGDNIKHVLRPDLRARTYDRPALSYIVEDIGLAFKEFSKWILMPGNEDQFRTHHVLLDEARMEVNYLFPKLRSMKLHSDLIAERVSPIAVKLGSLPYSRKPDYVKYVLDYVIWHAHSLTYLPEFMSPAPELVKTKKKGVDA